MQTDEDLKQTARRIIIVTAALELLERQPGPDRPSGERELHLGAAWTRTLHERHQLRFLNGLRSRRPRSANRR